MLQVMRRKVFKTVKLQSLGCAALSDYLSWYAGRSSTSIFPPSALDSEILRNFFLVPTVQNALSSMAHSFHVSSQGSVGLGLHSHLLASSIMASFDANATANSTAAPENHVEPALLDAAVASLEKVLGWQDIRRRRLELEATRSDLLNELGNIHTQMVRLPSCAQEVCSCNARGVLPSLLAPDAQLCLQMCVGVACSEKIYATVAA
jgi:hypothetical protein